MVVAGRGPAAGGQCLPRRDGRQLRLGHDRRARAGPAQHAGAAAAGAAELLDAKPAKGCPPLWKRKLILVATTTCEKRSLSVLALAWQSCISLFLGREVPRLLKDESVPLFSSQLAPTTTRTNTAWI